MSVDFIAPIQGSACSTHAEGLFLQINCSWWMAKMANLEPVEEPLRKSICVACQGIFQFLQLCWHVHWHGRLVEGGKRHPHY